MEYVPPLEGSGDDSYVQGSAAVDGSIIPALTLENPMREIVNAIILAGLTPDGGDVTQLAQAIVAFANSAASIDPGTIDISARTTPSAGWLLCDGSAVSRTTYSALFAAIGTTYGAGNGSTTFNLPDARGRALVGAGNASGLTNRPLGSKFGTETVALTAGQNGPHTHGLVNHTHQQTAHTHSTPAHTHPQTPHTHGIQTYFTTGAGSVVLQGTPAQASGVQQTQSGGGGNTGSGGAGTTGSAGGGATSAAGGGSTQSSGSGSAHNNVQPSLALNVFIKT